MVPAVIGTFANHRSIGGCWSNRVLVRDVHIGKVLGRSGGFGRVGHDDDLLRGVAGKGTMAMAACYISLEHHAHSRHCQFGIGSSSAKVQTSCPARIDPWL